MTLRNSVRSSGGLSVGAVIQSTEQSGLVSWSLLEPWAGRLWTKRPWAQRPWPATVGPATVGWATVGSATVGSATVGKATVGKATGNAVSAPRYPVASSAFAQCRLRAIYVSVTCLQDLV